MKVYKYEDFQGTHFITEAEIVSRWMPFWREQMERANKNDMINEDNCIKDFISVNEAYLVNMLTEG